MKKPAGKGTFSRAGALRTSRYIALLRGVNVGGKHRLAMADLAALFEAAGCDEVETYIQSGNVVFRAESSAIPAVVASVAKVLLHRLGAEIPIVVRSSKELRAACLANPFVAAGASPESLHVAFLLDKPSAARIAALDPLRSKPDAFDVRGREIYLHLPNGVARTKLTNDWFDRSLQTKSTLRNWRTTLALLELASR
jgi:uncharacterized protein (DUF1697 family)